MSDVIVTGSNGFVGRHVVAALRQAGLDVLATSRMPSATCDVAVDLTNPDALRDLFTEPAQAVVHLAAKAHGKGVPSDFQDVNAGAAAAMARAAANSGVRTYVLFSSASVYGEYGRSQPVAEDTPCAPVGPYAAAKYEAELATLMHLPNAIIFRPPAIYSSDWLLDVRKRAYVPGLTGRMLLRIPGRQPRHSLCAIEHAVEVTTMAVTGKVSPGVYNVADRVAYTQRDIADVVSTLDASTRALPLPRSMIRLAVGAVSAISSAETSSALKSNYWKLFEGLVLDTARIESCGWQGHVRLQDLAR